MRTAIVRARELGDPRSAPTYELARCDRHKVESALSVPQAAFGGHDRYPTIPLKAAALAYSFAKNHACGDGNKRLSALLMLVFLGLNGYVVASEAVTELDPAILSVAASVPADRDEVIARLAAWIDTVATNNGDDR